MGHPEDPVCANHVKVPQSLTVKVLKHLGHLDRQLYQSVVSIRACHAGSVINAVNGRRETFSFDLLDCLLNYVNAVPEQVVDVLGARLMEPGLN